MKATQADASPWSPLRVGVFRAIWLASVVSNMGSWMHLVGASWLMTSLTTSAALVALLSTASSLPMFVLALPAGAMADILDRRRLVLVTQAWQLVVAVLLGWMTLSGSVNPGVLLAATALLGIGTTLGAPAFAAITPDLVPKAELPAAISLNSVAMTASQAVGPALGGVLVAMVGSGGVFLLNAGSFLGVIAVVYLWHRPAPATSLPPEHLASAMRSGLRYVANAPEFRAVLIRAVAFVLSFGAMPSLLAVFTRVRLHGSASAYGLLLGALGVGGVFGALVLPRLRPRLGPDRIALAGSVGYAVCFVVLAQTRLFPMALVVLVFAGVAGMSVLSTLNIAAQSVLPGWIRGRGLAIFQLIFQVAFAISAAVWGSVATITSIPLTLTVAGVAMAGQTVLSIWFGLNGSEGLDVQQAHSSEPYTPTSLAPDDGPVLLMVEYRIPADRLPEFRAALTDLGRARRRNGAMRWEIYTDPADPARHVETFVAPSWEEHKRQSQRVTTSDAVAIETVRALHDGPDDPPLQAMVSDRGLANVTRNNIPVSNEASRKGTS
ncbi:MFS transporter [Nocardia sp. NPDC057030]|uniref:MFS transporter n=1 Tax=unclassified Nocardia TaxID=2637762 RepID=UPI00363015FE